MSQFLDVALQIADQAKATLLENHLQFRTLEVKSNNSVVTELDRKIEADAKSLVLSHFPEHGFYGEELGQQALDAEYVWIIDPIDGTREFTRGLPWFATLIALMHKGEIILGLVSSPVNNEVLYAERGRGAWLNGERVKVSGRDQLETAFVLGPAYKYLDRTQTWEQMAKLAGKVQGTRNVGAYPGYHWVATGHAEAMIEVQTFIYDIAAFVPIIQEAGGKVTDLQGGPITLQSTAIVASNGVLHEDILNYFI